MATEQVWANKSYELPLEEIQKLAPDIQWKYLPVIAPTLSPVEACQIIGEWYRACSSDARRVNAGQFFTPSTVAHYMATIADELGNGIHILDPGAGVGILASAICEKAIQQKINKIFITAYESDPVLYVLCRWMLTRTRDILNEYDIDISIELYQRDFVEAMAEKNTPLSLWSQDSHLKHTFDLAILNPPYFKVNQKDPRAHLVKEIAQGRTNMYTIFMSLAASTLNTGGRFVSITPRSFASGAYFKHFRQQFFKVIEPELIHIFDSRRSAFEQAEVLQENIILSGIKKGSFPVDSPSIIVSRSHGLDDQAVLLYEGQKQLVKNATQIVLRRFSAKEEQRRITAAVLLEKMFDTDFIALENHLNYLYRPGGTLSYEEAVGLAAFLNSSLVDRYFRIISGNTQVSATELRNLPLPSQEQIVRIGKQIAQIQGEHDLEATERIIMDILGRDLVIGDEEEIQLPVLKDSRILMGKIQEAQLILHDLGLPPAQQNEISALTLLALCSLSETSSWSEISQEAITIHNMMSFMKINYGRTYAENTREVVRRQVIHQFEQARLIDRNPDDHTRPTNSPNTCYTLTYEALETLKQYGSYAWENAVAHFLAKHGALWEQYQRSRQSVALPLSRRCCK